MPTVELNGRPLYYETAGEGFPLIFTHEFGGSYEAWEPQMRYFSRKYMVVTWGQRGFPPTPALEDPAAYSQSNSVEDLFQLSKHLGVQQAHYVALSMGSNVTLEFAMTHPELLRSLTLAGCGAGSINFEQARPGFGQLADRIEREGMEKHAFDYASARTQYMKKDPRGWIDMYERLRKFSGVGRANTLRGVQMKRPSIFELENELKQIAIPTLIIVGDEDGACVEPSLFMQKHIPNNGMVMFPKTGHTVNLEEPELFNATLQNFLTAVEQGAWRARSEEPKLPIPAPTF